MRSVTAALGSFVVVLLSPLAVLAQSAQPASSISVPRLIHVSGVFQPADGQSLSGVEEVTLAIYADQAGGPPLWQETQRVAVDAEGRYTLLLGASQTDGIPLDVFASGEAQWLGVVFRRPGEVEGPRMRITSVPYALRAGDAVSLGGRPASDFVLTATASAQGTTREGATAAATDTVVNPLSVLAGTTNALAKYVNAADVGPSAVSEVSGRVGINTGAALPADYLHVKFTDPFGAFTGLAVQNLSSNANAASGMLFYDQNGALGQFQGFNNSTHEYRINNIASGGSINFLLGGTSTFRVAPNGNVGISTVLPAHRLTVIGGPLWTSNGWTGAVALDNGAALGWYANGAGNRFGIGHSNGGLYFFRTASNPGTTGSAATYDVIINDAGNVGIGTTTPASKLEIAAAGASTGILVTSQGNNAIIGYSNTPNFAAIYGENNTNAGGLSGGFGMYGKGNANVGVGVRGDGYQGVYGSGHFGVFGTTQSAPGNSGYAIYGEDPTGYGYAGFFGGAVKILSNLSVDGAIFVNSLAINGETSLCLSSLSNAIATCSSSLRYKTNVTPFHSGLNLIDRLRPITFDWKASGEADLGLAAEEVATVEPRLVTYNATGEVEGVKYDRINVLLINAIKEQQAQIRQQHAQLEQQREEIETLGRRQEDLVALKALICEEHRAAAVCK